MGRTGSAFASISAAMNYELKESKTEMETLLYCTAGPEPRDSNFQPRDSTSDTQASDQQAGSTFFSFPQAAQQEPTAHHATPTEPSRQPCSNFSFQPTPLGLGSHSTDCTQPTAHQREPAPAWRMGTGHQPETAQGNETARHMETAQHGEATGQMEVEEGNGVAEDDDVIMGAHGLIVGTCATCVAMFQMLA